MSDTIMLVFFVGLFLGIGVGVVLQTVRFADKATEMKRITARLRALLEDQQKRWDA